MGRAVCQTPALPLVTPGEGCLPSPDPSREYFFQDEGETCGGLARQEESRA